MDPLSGSIRRKTSNTNKKNLETGSELNEISAIDISALSSNLPYLNRPAASKEVSSPRTNFQTVRNLRGRRFRGLDLRGMDPLHLADLMVRLSHNLGTPAFRIPGELLRLCFNYIITYCIVSSDPHRTSVKKISPKHVRGWRRRTRPGSCFTTRKARASRRMRSIRTTMIWSTTPPGDRIEAPLSAKAWEASFSRPREVVGSLGSYMMTLDISLCEEESNVW